MASAAEPTPALMRRVFAALHYPEFRLLWTGACVSSIGTWMQKLAQSWLVLQISNRPFLLGLDAFLGEIPILLFSLIGGVVADRADRRKLLVGSQVVQMTCAFLLAYLVASGTVEVAHILILSFVVGIAQAFGGPAYQALIPLLVAPRDLPNAIAMNSIQFNIARIIGPVLGGIALAKLGAAWCFSLNGISYIAVIATLLMLPMRQVRAAGGMSLIGSIGEGLRYIRGHAALPALIVLAFAMTLLGVPLVVFLPVIARDVFHRGPDAYTLLLSMSGAGAIAGALVVAAFGHVRQGWFALATLTAVGVLIVGVGLSRVLALSCVLVFLAGAALVASMSMTSSLVQLLAPDEMRGRVMSVYNVAFRGGMPIGSFVTGLFIEQFSVSPVLAANGILLAALGLYLLLMQRRITDL